MTRAHIGFAEHCQMPIEARCCCRDDVVFRLLRIGRYVSVERLSCEIADEPKPIRRRLSRIAIRTPSLPLVFALNADRLDEVSIVRRVDDLVQAINLNVPRILLCCYWQSLSNRGGTNKLTTYPSSFRRIVQWFP